MKLDNTFAPLIGIMAFVSLMMVSAVQIGVLDNYTCVASHLFVLIAMIVADYMGTKRITLFQIWNIGYIYILWAEMMQKSSSERYMNAISFILIANAVLTLGYLSFRKRSKKLNDSRTMWLLRKNKTNVFFLLMCIMLVSWLSGRYALVIASSASGRQVGSVLGNSINVGSFFISAFGLMVSGMAAFYYRWCSVKSVWWSALFLMPVFVFQILIGTRFQLIYIILPWLILTGVVNVKHQQTGKIGLLVLAAFFLSLASSFVKTNRGLSLQEVMNASIFDPNKKENANVFLWLADKMSPEGCVEMTFLAENWFDTHEYEYGKEIGFMFYWVIPRAIWKDKPTPIDHWLIRKYANVSDGHSTASGFTGEIRADFGYWRLIIVFVFGLFLHRLDYYVLNAFMDDSPSLEKIFAALIYPCVFFSVRSPLTATQSFFVEVLVFYAIRMWMGEKVVIGPKSRI